MEFMNFTITGDPAFDFFFSIQATFGLMIWLVSVPIALIYRRS
jgi:type IV secretory pathway TrbD component